ncbi:MULTISPECIES: protein-export chaperone SecB [Novacetimonas]|uniref:Protein-export protein SecB n=2 Tax=Novacetimonas TaxID=2919364 RepID=A0A318QFW8_9PROT|nr:MULTISPECIES: protein-export chaperone SecB [Novacetimonas]MBV1833156.1 protein-export chaperone SecB [Novacetimonas pomaceti]PYD48890.1 protein-export chaperone SecB [Novacetimonas pomaceti]PYD76764.1 protein-export chaperone SecB [Novacetimonas pomaceti]RBM09354.1 protein-export chaperone SecB [Novacetimonas cocois]
MTDTPSILPKDDEEPQAQPAPPMALNINHQYIKDLSFEVPGGAAIFQLMQGAAPTISIDIDTQANRLQQDQPIYEVTLTTKIEAKLPAATQDGTAGRTLFIAELSYAAIATLVAAPDAMVEPMLMVEVPRFIFPFVRAIICDVTRDGGFPPIVLQPIDFVALWQSKRNSFAQAAGHA